MLTFQSVPWKTLALCHQLCFQTLESLGPHYLKYLPKQAQPATVPAATALRKMLQINKKYDCTNTV